MFTIFGFDIRATTAMQIPQVYRQGTKKACLTRKILWMWQIAGLYTAVVIAYLPPTCLENIAGGSASDYSVTPGLWGLGGYCFTLVVLVTNVKLMIEMDSWTVMEVIGFTLFGGLPPWIVFAVVFSYPTWLIGWASLGGYAWHGLLAELWSNPTFWLLFILVPVTCLGPDLFYRGWHRAFHDPPDPAHIVQELVSIHGPDKALQIMKRAKIHSESLSAQKRRSTGNSFGDKV